MNTETVTPKVKTGRKVKWPLLSLAVGESLTVPLCDGPAQKISPILSATARRNPEFRFKQKKTDGGYVITRVDANAIELPPISAWHDLNDATSSGTDCNGVRFALNKVRPVTTQRMESANLGRHEEDTVLAHPESACANPDGDTMCANCDCWKATRANCS